MRGHAGSPKPLPRISLAVSIDLLAKLGAFLHITWVIRGDLRKHKYSIITEYIVTRRSSCPLVM